MGSMVEPPINDQRPAGNPVARKLRTARQILHDKGLAATVEHGRQVLTMALWRVIARPLNRRRTFLLDGRRYGYCLSDYNRPYFNERAVEVPVASAAIAECDGRVLEIGNVLAHYGVTGHTVADKYEPAPGVLNVDVVDLSFDEPFDLIVSISTLEHVGRDEQVKEPNKPIRAIEHLRSLLKPGGQLLVTIPIGYNWVLDAWLLSDAQPFESVHFLSRRALNRWVQTTGAEAARAAYDWPWMRAKCVAIGRLSQPLEP